MDCFALSLFVNCVATCFHSGRQFFDSTSPGRLEFCFFEAFGVFGHDEVVDAKRWHAPSFDQIRDSSYDVYVKNAHTAPYRKTFANISFHVNCDAPGKGD